MDKYGIINCLAVVLFGMHLFAIKNSRIAEFGESDGPVGKMRQVFIKRRRSLDVPAMLD